MTETDLIRLARQGNLEAFNSLVLQHQDRVYQQARWMLGDPQAADDICQETFLRAYRKIGSFRDGSFRAWLLRIAHRLCLDEMRRNRRRATLPLELQEVDGDEYPPIDWPAGSVPTPEDWAESSFMLMQIRQLLEHLSPEWRATLILVDLQGLDYAQTAAVLGIPLGTVKSRLARARRQLHDWLLASGALAEHVPTPPEGSTLLTHGYT